MMTVKGNFRTFSVVGLGSMLGLVGALGSSILPSNRDEISRFVYSLDVTSSGCSTNTGTGTASPCCYQRAAAARLLAEAEGKIGPVSCGELADSESCTKGSTSDLAILGDDLGEANVNAFTMSLMGFPREPLAAR